MEAAWTPWWSPPAVVPRWRWGRCQLAVQVSVGAPTVPDEVPWRPKLVEAAGATAPL